MVIARITDCTAENGTLTITFDGGTYIGLQLTFPLATVTAAEINAGAKQLVADELLLSSSDQVLLFGAAS